MIHRFISFVKSLSLPEWLAFFRVITFPILLVLVFVMDRGAFAWLYIILFSTDFFDGLAAKLLKNDSARREILDTWGDNLYLAVGIIGLIHHEAQFFQQNITVILIIAGLYLLELTISLIKFKKPSNFHNYSAKAAAFSQFVFITYMFYFDANLVLFYAAAFFSFLDLIDEFIILFSVNQWRTHIKGFWEVTS